MLLFYCFIIVLFFCLFCRMVGWLVGRWWVGGLVLSVGRACFCRSVGWWLVGSGLVFVGRCEVIVQHSGGPGPGTLGRHNAVTCIVADLRTGSCRRPYSIDGNDFMSFVDVWGKFLVFLNEYNEALRALCGCLVSILMPRSVLT